MDIRQMDLYRRHPDSSYGIAQRNAGMRISTGIDDNPGKTLQSGTLHLINQFTLVIRLEGLDFATKRNSFCF